jgi:hypothetical protein
MTERFYEAKKEGTLDKTNISQPIYLFSFRAWTDFTVTFSWIISF